MSGLRRLWCWLRGGHSYDFAGWGRWRTPDGRIPRKGEQAVFMQTFLCKCGKRLVRAGDTE